MEKWILLVTYFFTYILISYLQIKQVAWSRKSIFMGIRIPVEKRKSEELVNIYENYKKENILLGSILAILFSMLLYFNYDNILLVATLPLLYIFFLFLIYLKYNKKVSLIKEKKGWSKDLLNKTIVDMTYIKEREKIKGYFSWAKLELIIILVNILLIIYLYPSLPSKIPVHWNLLGQADKYSNKNIYSFIMLLGVQLIMTIIFYFSYRSIVGAKPELNKDSLDESIIKHRKYVAVWERFIWIIGLSIQVLFSLINLSSLGILKDAKLVSVFSLIFCLYVIVASIYLSIKYGQGGENYKDLGQMEYNRYYVDDDKNWLLGNTLYFNREDPSLFVEKRIGVGWTINIARPAGALIFIIPFIILIASLFLLNKYI